ncbi:hypothetical protein [Robertmurraya korlensis]|uniref:hypothetical protein n=1 Tax=Robertmurraya korlensis TaxID=519977 RepID=UPI00082539E8|nr:hypothetical protein [Robertmurraya korlensis]
MSDNINDNSEQNTSNNMEKDLGKNNSNSQSKVDLSSMMQLASTLLKNDVIMNSVTEQLSKNKPTATQSSKVTEKPENVQMSTLYKKLEETANDVSELKEEYKGLASLSEKIENLTNEISELTKVLKTVVEHQINPDKDKI